jgi:hypothetical protein
MHPITIAEITLAIFSLPTPRCVAARHTTAALVLAHSWGDRRRWFVWGAHKDSAIVKLVNLLHCIWQKVALFDRLCGALECLLLGEQRT